MLVFIKRNLQPMGKPEPDSYNNEDFSPNTDFMIKEWGILMKKVQDLPPSKSVDTIKTWSKLIRAGLNIEVWKN